MSNDLSPENEQYIASAVARGAFQSRADALNLGVGLLKQRHQLLDEIDEGIRQLRAGDLQEYDQDSLQRLFDRIQSEGLARYEAQKAGR
ncbi:MAG TPA: hypothetical protein VF306_16745 [Pirellulales bacterium]